MNYGLILVVCVALGMICQSLHSIAAHLRSIDKKMQEPVKITLDEMGLPPNLHQDITHMAWEAGRSFRNER